MQVIAIPEPLRPVEIKNPKGIESITDYSINENFYNFLKKICAVEIRKVCKKRKIVNVIVVGSGIYAKYTIVNL